MKTTWLARRLGLDGNPLRRRSDRIAIYLGALLLATFLIGAPQLSVAAVAWAGHAGAAGPRAEHTGYRVPAVRMSAGPARTAVAREATAAVVATATLGIMLLCLAWAGRWVLNRRRLAAWEKSWAVIGPQWTKRFRQQRGPP
jgi:hypothetical protein